MRFIYLVLGCIASWSILLHAHPTKFCELHFDNHVNLRHIPLASTPAERAKGLSGTHQIGQGMLFSFPTAEILSFWMKNTHVPLSIGFFDEHGQLFQIEDMQPNTLTVHVSTQVGTKALELLQGDFQRKGLHVGSYLTQWSCQ